MSIEALHLDCADEAALRGLSHDSLIAARKDTPGEGIYLALWQEYVAADPGRIVRLLYDTLDRLPTQRQASVCATFMKFMGCNCGRSFTCAAERIASEDTTRKRSDAFLMSWALENRRRRGVNSGVRTIEAMLAVDLWTYPEAGAPRLNMQALYAVEPGDYDTVDAMVEWWASQDAGAIRAAALPKIQAAVASIQARHHRTYDGTAPMEHA